MGYLPPGTHDWNSFRSPEEVRHVMMTNNTNSNNTNNVGSSLLKEVDVQGMVITKPPLFGRWDWKLDPNDTDVNWIGTYYKEVGEVKDQT
jgi:hypothetical protein